MRIPHVSGKEPVIARESAPARFEALVVRLHFREERALRRALHLRRQRLAIQLFGACAITEHEPHEVGAALPASGVRLSLRFGRMTRHPALDALSLDGNRERFIESRIAFEVNDLMSAL